MMFRDLKEEPPSMFNDSSCDTEKMKSQGFETDGPPGLRQCLSLHYREDIVSHDIESPPGRISKESFGRQYPCRQVIFEDIVNLFDRPTAFPLPPEQSLSIPTPHIGHDGKVVIGIPVLKEFSLDRSDTMSGIGGCIHHHKR
jgi:hypothetical protein